MKNLPDVFCPDQDLWSSFSCPLSGLNTCVPPAHEQKLKQCSVRPPLAGRQPLALILLFTSASTPSLIKAKAALLLIWMSEEIRQLCSWGNQAGPKTADMNVFLPCSVCISLVLGWLVVPAEPALTYPQTPTEDANESCWVSWAQVLPSAGAKSYDFSFKLTESLMLSC